VRKPGPAFKFLVPVLAIEFVPTCRPVAEEFGERDRVLGRLASECDLQVGDRRLDAFLEHLSDVVSVLGTAPKLKTGWSNGLSTSPSVMPSVSKLIWTPMSQADEFVSKWMLVILNGVGGAAVAGAAAAASARQAVTALPIAPVCLFMAGAPMGVLR
jgi:hypothetical protein